MRHLAAQQGGMQHARQFDVIDEQRLSGEQPASSLRLTGSPKVRVDICVSPASASAAAMHGIDDVLVSGATAKIARQRLAHLVFARRGVLVEKGRHGHEDAGRAVAALQAVMIVHRLLQRMICAVLAGEAFDRRNRVIVRLHGEHQAGAHRLAIEKDGAGAADAVLAADMGAGKRQIVANESRSAASAIRRGSV